MVLWAVGESEFGETPECVEIVVGDVTLEDEDEPLVIDCAIVKIADATIAVEEMKWLEDALIAGE